ncbi:MAG: NAD(P)-dependent glycerol-3-phosphate dehydrogenase [Phycisphaerales bacterium]|nr:NAD(P)-dependent glycerol-3-phosphate dehydrogenase [Phycisphaerales bacterium]
MNSSKPHHVAIIGTGQMGLVMADAMQQRGVRVSMWGPHQATVDQLHAERCVAGRLEGFRLDDDVRVTSDPSVVFAEATVALNAIPTQYIRATWLELLPACPPGTPIVSTAKGIENDTLLRPTEVLASLAEAEHGVRPELCVLSGPTIATELAMRLPAALIAASTRQECAESIQDLLDVPWIRTYTLADPIGVELAGATKNIIALAAGMADGLGLGDNAKSMLLARGLVEISRLGLAMGSKVETFFGIAGVGDLATTCFSPHGRNRTCGEAIGRGQSLDDFQAQGQVVVEGVSTTKSVLELAQRHGIEMPIATAVGSILFQGKAPKAAIHALMDRALGVESLQHD